MNGQTFRQLIRGLPLGEKGSRLLLYDILTNAEDVEAEAMADRLVDQLVWHAIKAYMARQGNSTGSFSLQHEKHTSSCQVKGRWLGDSGPCIVVCHCTSLELQLHPHQVTTEAKTNQSLLCLSNALQNEKKADILCCGFFF